MNTDIASARKAIKKSGLSSNIVTPQKLVSISATMQKSFDETLNLIAYLKMQGQGYSPFPLTAKVLAGRYS
jgi:hypothetical protein